MKNTILKYSFLFFIAAVGGVCSAAVLLNDTFADSSRLETNLPNESTFWASSPGDVTVGVSSVQQAMATSSRRLHTYFTPANAPASLELGDKLITRITFSPKGALYSSTSRNFRLGLFYDDNGKQLADGVGDSGGTGDPWMNATGYAVQFSLSSGTGATIQIGKRTSMTTASLLGSGSAYTWITGEALSNLTLGTVYTMTMTLEYQAVDALSATFTFANGETVLATASMVDNETGGLPVYTDFDFLLFRFSQASGCADIVDIHSIKIEHIEAAYSGPEVGTFYSAYANVSCRTEGATYATTNRTDSSKLSVRASANGVKSWIKFDISEMGITDPNNLKYARLRVALHAGKGGEQTCDVSFVNDNYRTNIGWGETQITWNNAPGNNTSDLGLLNPTQTTLLEPIVFTDGTAGQQFYVDVVEAIKTDTDGILQFVLHNSPNLLDFATHDHPGLPGVATPEEIRPRLEILEGPAGADYPRPYYGQTVQTSLSELSWVNPEPNDPGATVTCTVYLGTEPNRPQMDSVALATGVSSVAINTDMFPNFGNLQNETTYYWAVDCFDTSAGAGYLEGLMWWFNTQNNTPPQVNAGANQAVWLGMVIEDEVTVTLSGVTSDDGLPEAIYTVLWTQDSGPSAAIADADQDVASVTFTERGVYVFRLTADDSEMDTFDTVIIYVGDNSCDASHMSTGDPYLPGDVNEDCLVDMADFAELLSANWLVCTDSLTHCGME